MDTIEVLEATCILSNRGYLIKLQIINHIYEYTVYCHSGMDSAIQGAKEALQHDLCYR